MLDTDKLRDEIYNINEWLSSGYKKSDENIKSVLVAAIKKSITGSDWRVKRQIKGKNLVFNVTDRVYSLRFSLYEDNCIIEEINKKLNEIDYINLVPRTHYSFNKQTDKLINSINDFKFS